MEVARGPVDETSAREVLATVLRTAIALDLVDVLGLAAVRLDDRRVLMTPGPDAAATLGRLRPDDLLVVDVDADRDVRRGTLPPLLPLALHALDAAPGACVLIGAPDALMTLAAVGRRPLPLAHTNAELCHAGIELVRPTRLPTDRRTAAELLTGAGAAPTVLLQGLGVLVRAPSALEALRRLDGLALLGRLTVALGRRDTPPTVGPAAAAAIAASRPVEPVPSRDPVRYFRTVDPGSDRRTLADDLPVDGGRADTDVARRALAVASRVLAAEGLVTYYEHLSTRAPERDDAFLMTPAHDYHRMLPGDVGLVAMDEDGTALACRFPPAPFRWLHRDLFLARPDALAIVHTHPLHGRIRHLVGEDPVRWHHGTASAPATTPVLTRPSLLFDPDDRAELVRLTADGPSVHALHHGTDFLAPSLAEATVMALQDEDRARRAGEAATLGAPTPLAPALLEDLRRDGPDATAQLAFRAARLAPLSAVTHAPSD